MTRQFRIIDLTIPQCGLVVRRFGSRPPHRRILHTGHTHVLPQSPVAPVAPEYKARCRTCSVSGCDNTIMVRYPDVSSRPYLTHASFLPSHFSVVLHCCRLYFLGCADRRDQAQARSRRYCRGMIGNWCHIGLRCYYGRCLVFRARDRGRYRSWDIG